MRLWNAFGSARRWVALREREDIESKMFLAKVCVVTSAPFAAMDVLGLPRPIAVSMLLLSLVLLAVAWGLSRTESVFPGTLFPQTRRGVLDVLLSLEEAITLVEGGLRQVFKHVEETGALPPIEGPIGDRFARATRIMRAIEAKGAHELNWRVVVAHIAAGSIARLVQALNEVKRMKQILDRAIPIITAIEGRSRGQLSDGTQRGSSGVLADGLPILLDAETMRVDIENLIAAERLALGVPYQPQARA